jgi:hypothetical protein
MSAFGWIRQLLTRDRMTRDAADEIALHLEEKIDELMAAGLTRQAATAAAHRAFGNATLVREDSRDVWRWRFLDDVAGDIRYALRQLRRTPSFAAAAILTLAIGIGANSAVYSVVSAVVLRPLPFPSPDRLVSVALMDVRGTPRPTSLAYFTFFELRRAAVFERIACYRDFGVTLTGGDLPVHLDGVMVSWDLFDLLGVPPALGRGFLPNEEAPDARVVVLGYDTWQTQFSGDPGIVGRSIAIEASRTPWSAWRLRDSRIPSGGGPSRSGPPSRATLRREPPSPSPSKPARVC